MRRHGPRKGTSRYQSGGRGREDGIACSRKVDRFARLTVTLERSEDDQRDRRCRDYPRHG
jgi:hypothetical protein